jgi:alcohol dehydrogenase class IV
MGAVAFQKGLGVVHSLAHPLSSLLDTHHGLANAINLPYGMEFNLPVSGSRMKTIAGTIGLPNPSAETFIAWLRDLNRKLGIPSSLKALHVNESHIQKLSDLAIKDPCHGSNERPVTRADFEQIFTRAIS